MLTAILVYLVGLVMCAVIAYFTVIDDDVTVGDFITLGIISLSAWAGVLTFILGGIANIITSLNFGWMQNVVIEKKKE